MSILVYIESNQNQIKKSSFESLSYAKKLSKLISLDVIAVVINCSELAPLSDFGPDKIISIDEKKLQTFNAHNYADVISNVSKSVNAKNIIISDSINCKYLASLLSVKLNAAFVSNVVSLPNSTNPFVVKRSTFSNKAFCEIEINSEIRILSISKNSIGLNENKSEPIIINPDIYFTESKLTSESIKLSNEKVSIEDADVVVSAGRGLKGPENWNIVEDLAKTLNAATACSKPVSDMGWRPHSEHVGQTGKPVSTNLYIAIGISGAIQHLAGVSSSKVKVVINNDPEAPFFKVADYGIVGDAFEVVPKLNEKLKAFQAENN
ncbi:electron transfer flavoprotein subunit alpha/FixB family protein [Flavobacteriales bacterium]|nr:electron transfer flavoprotein subunit alpha/FixB family protein [Flavobacteriales bacterium]